MGSETKNRIRAQFKISRTVGNCHLSHAATEEENEYCYLQNQSAPEVTNTIKFPDTGSFSQKDYFRRITSRAMDITLTEFLL